MAGNKRGSALPRVPLGTRQYGHGPLDRAPEGPPPWNTTQNDRFRFELYVNFAGGVAPAG